MSGVVYVSQDACREFDVGFAFEAERWMKLFLDLFVECRVGLTITKNGIAIESKAADRRCCRYWSRLPRLSLSLVHLFMALR